LNWSITVPNEFAHDVDAANGFAVSDRGIDRFVGTYILSSHRSFLTNIVSGEVRSGPLTADLQLFSAKYRSELRIFAV
jgi:hypothetical protein